MATILLARCESSKTPKILIWGDVICTLDASSYTHFRPWIQQLKSGHSCGGALFLGKLLGCASNKKKFTVYIEVYRWVFCNVSSQGRVRPSAIMWGCDYTVWPWQKLAVWSCMVFWKISPHLCQLFRSVLQRFFSVKLQKCCVSHKTSQLSISMKVNRWWLNLIIGWTLPLSICSLMQLLRGYCEYLHVP